MNLHLRRITFAISISIFLSIPNILLSQSQTFSWQMGETYQQEIAIGGSHSYEIDLEVNTFFVAVLMQEGIDLIITAYDEAGKKIKEFDSPNGDRGPEPIVLSIEAAGRYRFEVKPLDDLYPKGNYTLKIQRIAPIASTPEGRVDQLFELWNHSESPGASIAVVQDGKVIYSKGYGMANLEYDAPITPNTIFHIASISKQFTTFAVLLLAMEGKLSLDDDIRTHIPEVPDFGKVITLRHLAHHTSGMRDQWNLLAMGGWRLDDVITKDHVMKLVGKQKDLNFEPGEEYLYCNTGFTLLGEVVARVSGKSFAEFCQEKIFEPLGMGNTLFYDDHEKIVKGRAYSYYSLGNGHKKAVLSYANAGATSLFTTPEDLAKWALNFERPKVGDPSVIDQMNTQGILNSGKEITYALGQVVGEYKGLKRIGHGGADAGYRTQLFRFPDQKFSVIVFSNLASFNPYNKAHEIADIYLADHFVEKKKEEEKPGTTETESVEVSMEILETYVGNYELQPGFVIKVSLEDGKLFGQATGQNAFELKATSQNTFLVEVADAKIEFIELENGVTKSLILYQGGQEMKASRIDDFDPKSVNLSKYVGKYYSEELSTFYEFVLENDTLIARHPRHPDFALEVSKDDLLIGSSWYFRQIEMVRDTSQTITGCKVSSGRVRNVWFEKM